MCENQELQDPLMLANEVYQHIAANVQKRYTSAPTLEMRKTLPFWVRCFKESVLYRSTELTSTAIDLFRRDALVSAAIIMRSLIETTALFNRLYEYCNVIVKKGTLDVPYDRNAQEFIRVLRKLSLGTTDKSVEKYLKNNIEPFQVNGMVKCLNTRFGFNAFSLYTDLCQIAHPNYRGCMNSFTNWNQQKNCVEFIRDYRHMKESAAWFQNGLALILNIVENLEIEIEELLPKFAKICEEYEKRQKDKGNEQNK